MSDEQRTAAVSEGCMTIAQAQQFTGLGRSLLYVEMERGNLPYVKVGKRRLIPRRGLLQFLEAGLVAAK
jgi:excisionase family DNA binding protein